MSRNFYETAALKTYRNIDTFQRICRVRFEALAQSERRLSVNVSYFRYALFRNSSLHKKRTYNPYLLGTDVFYPAVPPLLAVLFSFFLSGLLTSFAFLTSKPTSCSSQATPRLVLQLPTKASHHTAFSL